MKVKSEELRIKKAKAKAEGEGRKVGRRPTFSARKMANIVKTRQWCVVLSRIGALMDELRILRQTNGITAGEKKAIGAMIDKLCKFCEYGLHCCTKEGGAK